MEFSQGEQDTKGERCFFQCKLVVPGTWQQYLVLLVIASSGQRLASEFFLWFGLWDGVTVQLQFHLETGLLYCLFQEPRSIEVSLISRSINRKKYDIITTQSIGERNTEPMS